MPVPRMKVGRHREQAAVREEAITGIVRISVRLEPPPEERHNVTRHIADGEMAGDRLQPHVAVSNQYEELRRGKDGQQVRDEELVRPCDVVFQVEPGVPLTQMFPDGRVREFTVRVAQDEVERCRPFGLMRHTVVGGQQPDYRSGARFRLGRRRTPSPAAYDGQELRWSNRNGVVVHHYRFGGSVLVPLQLVEIQPDRFGHQAPYLILGFASHADARKFRYIRSMRAGAVLLYNDEILSLSHLRSPCSPSSQPA